MRKDTLPLLRNKTVCHLNKHFNTAISHPKIHLPSPGLRNYILETLCSLANAHTFAFAFVTSLIPVGSANRRSKVASRMSQRLRVPARATRTPPARVPVGHRTKRRRRGEQISLPDVLRQVECPAVQVGVGFRPHSHHHYRSQCKHAVHQEGKEVLS